MRIQPAGMMPTLLLSLFLAAACPQEHARTGDTVRASRDLVREFRNQGVQVDIGRGLIQLEGQVCQLYEPLEYLLVIQPRGKDHEALLFVEGVNAEALNAAMLLLGVEKGSNGTLIPKDPPPTMEEMQAGVPGFTVEHAGGDGFYIYVAWEEKRPDGKTDSFLYRAEDLVLNIRTERTYQRGRWVYLGSRFIKPHKDAPEMFAAEAEGNLVSLCYFNPANHLLTGSDPEADNQYVWYPNLYLLPEIGHPVKIFLSRKPLETPPPQLPVLEGE